MPRLLHQLVSRTAAAFWTARGCRALVRGDAGEAVRALHRALVWRPGAFAPLLHLTRAYLRRRELLQAHRTLAQARESDPVRFQRLAPLWLAGEGVDFGSLARVFGGTESMSAPARPRAATVLRPAPTVAPGQHPYGDCKDLDEYAHFEAMPPITEAEREQIDWDALLADLLED